MNHNSIDNYNLRSAVNKAKDGYRRNGTFDTDECVVLACILDELKQAALRRQFEIERAVDQLRAECDSLAACVKQHEDARLQLIALISPSVEPPSIDADHVVTRAIRLTEPLP